MFTYKKTYFVTELDDIFFNVRDYISFKVDRHDVDNVLQLYENEIDKSTIIIDSRLTEIIIYAFMKYEHNIIVYNVSDNRFITIFDWSRITLLLNINSFNIEYLKRLLFLYLLIVFYFQESWNSNRAKDILMQNKNEYFFISDIIEYLNVSTSSAESKKELRDQIENILQFKNLKKIMQINKNKYSIIDIQTELKSILMSRNIISFTKSVKI